jgi:hypothetical protein
VGIRSVDRFYQPRRMVAAMNHEIEVTIRMIEAKLRQLEQLRRTLIEEFETVTHPELDQVTQKIK